MGKLMCRNEAVDFAGIAGTEEYQAPPQFFALTSCSWTSWIHGQETESACFLRKVK